jgi:O-succinylbenzoic acid--CoA ligase
MRQDRWWLGVAAERWPDARALTVGGETVSYRELAAAARERAAALAARGAGRGDRIAWLGSASRQTVELLHAAQLLGAALCPLATRGTDRDLVQQVGRVHPRLIACDGEAHGRAAAIAAQLGCDLIADASLMADGLAQGLPRGEIDPAAPLALLCTSGTTGEPKAVVLSNAACHASALAAGQRLDYQAGQAWLATMPLHHVGGLSILLRAAIFGAEVVLHDGFDAERTRADVVRYSVRHASLVPTMLHRLLALERDAATTAALSSCCVLVGGAALSEDLARRAADAGLDVRATYGMTETASQTTTTVRGEVLEFPQTVGRPLDGVTVSIEAPTRDCYGEILVAGPTLFCGYFGDDVAPGAALRDGVLWTGDIGRMDADGRLYVASRRTDLIVTGGENVRPEEVERVLESHPAVAEAGVYGVPDEEWGQRVAAAVVARDGAHIDPAELEQWCRERLAAFKIPRCFDVATRLPRTAGGKLVRAKLRGGKVDPSARTS